MALYVLDTDTLSLHQRQHPKVMAAVAAHGNSTDSVCISTITIEEQISGWSGLARAARTLAEHEIASVMLLGLVDSWSQFGRVPFLTAARVRSEQLLKAKLNVGGKDLRIASIALELGATVVTRNRRDFGRVPGLVIEDWSI